MSNLKGIIFTLNIVLGVAIFATVIALSSNNAADAQGDGSRLTAAAGTAQAAQSTAEIARTTVPVTADAAQSSAAATAQAVQNNLIPTQTSAAATVEAARTNAAATRTSVESGFSETATYVATAVQQTREDYQATATVVFMNLDETISEQVTLLLEALEAEGVLLEIQGNTLYMTISRTEAETTATLNTVLASAGYSTVTGFVDYVASDTVVVTLQDVPSGNGTLLDYTLTYVIIYDSATDTYGLLLTEVRINGFEIPAEDADALLLAVTEAALDQSLDPDAAVEAMLAAEELDVDYSLVHDVTDVYTTNTSYVFSFTATVVEN